jgi:hypothetical protein
MIRGKGNERREPMGFFYSNERNQKRDSFLAAEFGLRSLVKFALKISRHVIRSNYLQGENLNAKFSFSAT